MEENKVKELFEKFDNEFSKDLQKEVYFDGNRRIDYTVSTGNRVIGIEVKGSNSGIYTTLGQLLIMKKTFSDLYLLAPLYFIKKIIKTIQELNLLNEIGLLMIAKNSLIILKRPEILGYYYKPNVKQRKARKLPKNSPTINVNDIEVFQHFKDKTFTVIDMMNEFQLSRPSAYLRISKLKKIGVIDTSRPLQNPRAYKFIKSIEEPKLL